MTEIKKGTAGGIKNHFLRVNRAEILAYYEAYGEAATCEKYNTKPATLQRLINGPEPRVKPHTKLDRAIYLSEVAKEKADENSHEVARLERQFHQFVPLVANELAEKFFKPLIERTIQLPAELEEMPDSLDITDFYKKLKDGS